ncbi:MAG: TetR/AcrR family transcriptional regulator [Firmicutes bacterium]|nr:TetR/AcrR family transcriptional regulator [Bacillota bacterium]
MIVDVPETLIQIAAELFASRGYDATSVNDIVEAASVTKGALYYYFNTKEELLFAIHQRFIEAEMAQAQKILARYFKPAERIRRLIISLIESIAEFRNEVTVFFRERHRLSPELFAQVQAARDQYEAIFEEAIREGQQEGTFRSDLDARLMTLALFGQCNWTYTWMKPGPLTPRELGEHLAEIFLRGALNRSS